MRLNHIGIATAEPQKTADLLGFFGYTAGPMQYDENQKVNVRFLCSEGAPVVELLSPVGGGVKRAL